MLAVRRHAQAVLARHPLRAADAAQLGAALAVAAEQAPPLGFVCLDERLLDAAERDGLRPVDGTVRSALTLLEQLGLQD